MLIKYNKSNIVSTSATFPFELSETEKFSISMFTIAGKALP